LTTLWKYPSLFLDSISIVSYFPWSNIEFLRFFY
jgi:hypothetical protein